MLAGTACSSRARANVRRQSTLHAQRRVSHTSRVPLSRCL
ncbi:hypothetical protein CPT_Momento_017 [Burkholderia phage Momento]|uniref:Uncharacterized protein n=1 Tax=Burkholderia phage Momento TaxID=2924902 RepID=A0AAE9G9Z9_9CAUD|nr:hypothetical protein CPT_Momento_017 [Burkholderia phage Momento]